MNMNNKIAAIVALLIVAFGGYTYRAEIANFVVPAVEAKVFGEITPAQDACNTPEEMKQIVIKDETTELRHSLMTEVELQKFKQAIFDLYQVPIENQVYDRVDIFFDSDNSEKYWIVLYNTVDGVQCAFDNGGFWEEVQVIDAILKIMGVNGVEVLVA